MTKEQALDKFWNSFGFDAYDESSVPQGTVFPYITYEVATDSLRDYATPLSASLWFEGTSWKNPTSLSNIISHDIGYGGKVIRCDDGYIWIVRGSPFSRRMSEPEKETIKRIVLNIEVQFLTEN